MHACHQHQLQGRQTSLWPLSVLDIFPGSQLVMLHTIPHWQQKPPSILDHGCCQRKSQPSLHSPQLHIVPGHREISPPRASFPPCSCRQLQQHASRHRRRHGESCR